MDSHLLHQRREAGRDDTRVMVIYLDDYHVRRGNGLRAKAQLAEFVRQLAPNDLVAISVLLTPVTAVTFSRNHEGTAQAIMNFEGRKDHYTPGATPTKSATRCSRPRSWRRCATT